MAEQLIHSVDKLWFDAVNVGDQIRVVTGISDEAWQYDFIVDESHKTQYNKYPQPHCRMVATNSAGDYTNPFGFQLAGCGRWTNRRQNPVQKQEHAFTPCTQGLLKGDFMYGKVDGQSDLSVFDKTGQEISQVFHTPFRENAVLRALGGHAIPRSVNQVIKSVTDNEAWAIEPKDVRATLEKLVKAGRVNFLQKKVQLFELGKLQKAQ
jgi:hypothetical protein